MTTATDAVGLLEAIRAAPGDDVPRLVFADWLEDDGQAERAEFVRLQIALVGPEGLRFKCGRTQSIPWCSDPECHWCSSSRRRERELLLGNCLKWAPRLSAVRTFEVILSPKWAFSGTPAVEFRRGFVDRVCCPLAAWCEYGPALVRAHPVTRVELTDKNPIGDGRGSWGWMPVCSSLHDAGQLPHSLADYLPGARTVWGGIMLYVFGGEPKDALDALIAWAKLPDAKRGQP